jgi:hypothetical protein
MTDMESYHVYYNKGYYDHISFEKQGYFYIGDGNIYIQGEFKEDFPISHRKTKLKLVFINSYFNYNSVNYISTKSYETIAEDIIYESSEDILNTNEMIKIWHKYKNHKCVKTYNNIISFKVYKGNLLNKLYVRPMKLVDYIINSLYNNQLIKEEDMCYIPFTLRNKIMLAYNPSYESDESNYFYNLFNEFIHND